MDEKEASHCYEQWLRDEVVPTFDRVAAGQEQVVLAEDVFSGLESRYRSRKNQSRTIG